MPSGQETEWVYSKLAHPRRTHTGEEGLEVQKPPPMLTTDSNHSG